MASVGTAPLILNVGERKVKMLKTKGERGKINTWHNSSTKPDDVAGGGSRYKTPRILKFGTKQRGVANFGFRLL